MMRPARPEANAGHPRKNPIQVRSLTDPSDMPTVQPLYIHRWLTGAVVGFELVVEANLVQIGTNEFFPNSFVLLQTEGTAVSLVQPSEIWETQSKRSARWALPVTGELLFLPRFLRIPRPATIL
jgi:hypothetical protein